MKKKVYRFVFIFFLIATFVCGVAVSVSAKNSCSRTKTFTSVRVVEGDTLWKIASEYYTEDFKDMNSYIYEIKKSNKLYSDKIVSGQTILIPYYR